ncbi:MAG: DUF488 domain-containing protein [Planctomycetota bacterium]
MATNLFTIGYEGINLDDFVAQLKNSAINCLIDVRRIPLSRKPGFSKSALTQKLAHENIDYVHFKELGSPESTRAQLKSDRNYDKFFSAVRQYLSTKTDILKEASGHVIRKNCCLMCFERQAGKCHRTLVASLIKQQRGNSLRIINL